MKPLTLALLSVSLLCTSHLSAQDVGDLPPPGEGPLRSNGTIQGVNGDVRAGILQRQHGFSSARALEQAEIEAMAIDAIDAIATQFEGSFAGYSVSHDPRFVYTIFVARDIDNDALRTSLPNRLRPYLRIKKTSFNLSERQQLVDEAAQALRRTGNEFRTKFSLDDDALVVELEDMEAADKVRELLPDRARNKALIRRGVRGKPAIGVTPTGVTSQDQIYGGWPLYGFGRTATGSNARNYCTVGFSGRNSQSQDIIYTAGHCIREGGVDFTMKVPSYDGSKWITLPVDNKKLPSESVAYDYVHLNVQGFATAGGLIYFRNSTDPYDQDTYYRTTNPQRFINDSPNIVPNLGREGYIGIIGTKRRSAMGIGTSVCKMGIFTGITCGKVTDDYYSEQDVSGFVEMGQTAQPYIVAGGDSGGPVFTPPDANGQAYALGIISFLIPDPTYTSSSKVCVAPYDCRMGFMPIEKINDHYPTQMYVWPNSNVTP